MEYRTLMLLDKKEAQKNSIAVHKLSVGFLFEVLGEYKEAIREISFFDEWCEILIEQIQKEDNRAIEKYEKLIKGFINREVKHINNGIIEHFELRDTFNRLLSKKEKYIKLKDPKIAKTFEDFLYYGYLNKFEQRTQEMMLAKNIIKKEV